jgi:hypothetical protein
MNEIDVVDLLKKAEHIGVDVSTLLCKTYGFTYPKEYEK